MSNRVLPIVAFLGIAGAAVVLIFFATQIGMDPGAASLLDAELELRSEGTTWTFTAERAGSVRLTVDMPPGCTKEGRLTLSPLYVALRDGVSYEPSREPEHDLTIPPEGLPSTRLELAHAGAYVLRMEPIPMAMGNESNPSRARIRVLRVSP